MINKKLDLAFFLFIFLFLMAVLVKGAPPSASWWGTLEIDGNTSPTGAIIEAFVGSALNGNTTESAYTSGLYLLDVACTEGENVTIKVYGVEADQSGQSCSQGASTELNLTMNKTADGTSCTNAKGCTADYCYGGTCGTTTTTTPAATTTAPSGGGGGGGGAVTTTTPATTAPATTVPGVTTKPAVTTKPKKVTTRPSVTTKPKKPWVPLGIELSTIQIVGIIVGIVVILFLVIFLFVRFQAVKMAT